MAIERVAIVTCDECGVLDTEETPVFSESRRFLRYAMQGNKHDVRVRSTGNHFCGSCIDRLWPRKKPGGGQGGRRK